MMNNKNQQDAMIYSSTGLQENTACVISYLGAFFTGLMFLVFEENSKLVKFHAMQSILFFSAIFTYVPYGSIGNTIVVIIAIPIWFFLMVKGYRREHYKLPFYGQLAENLLEKIDQIKNKFQK